METTIWTTNNRYHNPLVLQKNNKWSVPFTTELPRRFLSQTIPESLFIKSFCTMKFTEKFGQYTKVSKRERATDQEQNLVHSTENFPGKILPKHL